MKPRFDLIALPHVDVSAILPKSQGPLLELSVRVCFLCSAGQGMGGSGVGSADKLPRSDYGIFLVGESFAQSAG